MKKYIYSFVFLSVAVISLLSLNSCAESCLHISKNEETVSPTCTAEGYTLYSCQDCDYSFKTDYTPPIAHDIKCTVTAPTCDKGGFTDNACSLCDYTFVSDVTAPLGHKFKHTVKEPTCTSEGFTNVLCEVCYLSYVSDYVKPLEHKFEVKLTEPTCDKSGYSTLLCSVCNISFITDIVEPQGHSYKDTVVLPTCTESGYTSHYCSVCNETVLTDHVAPKGHSYKDTVIAPTCVLSGYTERFCPDCRSTVVTDYTDPTGHSMTKTRIFTTSSSAGYINNVCAKCTYSYKSDFMYSNTVFGGAYSNNEAVLERGIDVSYHNGDVDFEAIADSGIDFVIIRAGYSGVEDVRFDEYYKAAKAAGLKVGAYFYTYAKSRDKILEDADLFAEILEGKQFEYPVYLDMEDDSLCYLGKDVLTQMCIDFIEKMQSKGYYCGLYINENWLVNYLHKDVLFALFDIWYARFNYSSEDPDWSHDIYGANKGIWQYTDRGTIGDHECAFDLNKSYKDYSTVIKQFGYNGYWYDN